MTARNAPCPCGSGRRYKDCCGRVGPAGPHVTGAAPPDAWRAVSGVATRSTAAPLPGVEATLSRAVALNDRGRATEAAALLEPLLSAHPDHAGAWIEAGIADWRSRRLSSARARFERAVALQPSNAHARCNLGMVLRDLGEPEAAVAALGRALALAPDMAEAHHNLGLALTELMRLDEAIARLRRAVALAPGHAEARANLGTALLLAGQWREGFAEFEHRLKASPPLAKPPANVALWNGEPLRGARLLLIAEQGFGDTLHFAGLARLLEAHGARVFAQVQPAVLEVLRGAPGLAGLVPIGEPAPPADFWCPLLGLGHRLSDAIRAMGTLGPYIRPDAARRRAWVERLARFPGRKVGVAWAGNPLHRNDRNRSMAAAALAPLRNVAGATFFSLQKDAAPGALETSGLAPVDLAPDLDDFADTAGALSALDAVVCVDTAVAHLAGAMGVPTLLLLAFRPDWRWGARGEATPWYPSVRLFRQDARGDWRGPVERAALALAAVGPPDSARGAEGVSRAR